MVEVSEDCSPASIPIFSPTWTEIRSSINTEIALDGKRINFSNGSFRFERTTEEFYDGSNRLDFKILFTNPSYYWICFGVGCESNFDGNKGSYYFANTIMYSSYYPKVTVDNDDVSYDTFSVKHGDLVSIIFDIDSSTIQFVVNEKEMQVRNVNLSNKQNKSWYFLVGMFEGAVEIIN